MKPVPAAVLLVTAIAVAACASSPPATLSDAATPDAAGLVDIRTRVPDIDLDIRYAGDHNFVGTRIDGYGAARCYLLADAADALRRAELELRRESMRLRLYDCYRPVRAVRHFVAWAGDLGDQRTKAEYYPRLDKRQLLGDYISATSGHSRGATLDLTLLQCLADGTQCEPLDMGTPFDFFDTRANTDSTQVDARQRGNRERLRSAMERAGFRNYPMEWWHFTLDPEPAPKVFFDVPIE